jgi:ribonuclease T2
MKKILTWLSICIVTILIVGNVCVEKVNAEDTKSTNFDYYLFTLSWSPQYCNDNGNSNSANTQCNNPQRKYDFVVHGLWPQYDKKRNGKTYPESCSNISIDDSLVDKYLDIMPSRKLIRHEWEKHGTCSGMTPQEYFATTRKLYNSFKIPAKYRQPKDYIVTSKENLEKDLIKANPNFSADEIAVQCKKRYLQEVWLCYDKNFRDRSCGKNVVDRCSNDSLVLRPTR